MFYAVYCVSSVYWECVFNAKSDRLAGGGLRVKERLKLHLSTSFSACLKKHEMKAWWPVPSSEECLINLTGQKWMMEPGIASHGETSVRANNHHTAAWHQPAISKATLDNMEWKRKWESCFSGKCFKSFSWQHTCQFEQGKTMAAEGGNVHLLMWNDNMLNNKLNLLSNW